MNQVIVHNQMYTYLNIMNDIDLIFQIIIKSFEVRSSTRWNLLKTIGSNTFKFID